MHNNWIDVINLNYSNASLYTTFLVVACDNSVIAKCNREGVPTREQATYNCPWPNAGSNNQTPTFWSVWPWLLFMVIANAGRTGNWRRFHFTGKLSSVLVSSIRGMNTSSPLLSPVTCFYLLLFKYISFYLYNSSFSTCCDFTI